MASSSLDGLYAKTIRKNIFRLFGTEASPAEVITGLMAALAVANNISNPALRKSMVRFVASKSNSVDFVTK